MEDLRELEFAKKVFSESMGELESEFNSTQMNLWNAKKADEPINATCKKFGVKPKDYKTFLSNSTDRFKSIIPDVSTRLGTRMSYRELVEALS
jgi:hypothetical protein